MHSILCHWCCFSSLFRAESKPFANKKARNGAKQGPCRRRVTGCVCVRDEDDDGFRKRWKFSDKPNCGTDAIQMMLLTFFSQLRIFVCAFAIRRLCWRWVHPLALLLNHSFRIILNNSPERFISILFCSWFGLTNMPCCRSAEAYSRQMDKKPDWKTQSH